MHPETLRKKVRQAQSDSHLAMNRQLTEPGHVGAIRMLKRRRGLGTHRATSVRNTSNA